MRYWILHSLASDFSFLSFGMSDSNDDDVDVDDDVDDDVDADDDDDG